MNHIRIINELKRNRSVFSELLKGISKEEYLWKQNSEKWCLLEIVCHLYDEEREDFGGRTKQVLNDPNAILAPIDPAGWVKSRNYIEQNYDEMLDKFLNERDSYVEWLLSLKDPKWDNAHMHPKFGAMSAELFFVNWLAHDLLHLRQILKLKHDYLKQSTKEDLGYAGEW